MWFNPFVEQEFHNGQLKKKTKKTVHAEQMYVSHMQKQIYSHYCILAL